jgi:putative transposase
MTKKINHFNKIDPKLIDELIKTYEKPEDLLGEDGILKQVQKAMLERILEGEITTN